MGTKFQKFNIINKIQKIVDYVYTITETSPKKLRCDIVPELRRQSLIALENTIKANRINISKNTDAEDKKKRHDLQIDADVAAQMVESLSEICWEKGYIVKKQFEYLTTLTYSFRLMIASWMVSDNNRLSQNEVL